MARGGVSSLREERGAFGQLVQQRPLTRLEVGDALLAVLDLVQFCPGLVREAQDVRDRAAVLPFEIVDQIEALLDLLEARRIELDLLAVLAHAPGEVADLLD